MVTEEHQAGCLSWRSVKDLKQNMPSPSRGGGLCGTAPSGVQTLAERLEKRLDCVSHLKVFCVRVRKRESEEFRSYMIHERPVLVLFLEHFLKVSFVFLLLKKSEQCQCFFFLPLDTFYANASKEKILKHPPVEV